MSAFYILRFIYFIVNFNAVNGFNYVYSFDYSAGAPSIHDFDAFLMLLILLLHLLSFISLICIRLLFYYFSLFLFWLFNYAILLLHAYFTCVCFLRAYHCFSFFLLSQFSWFVFHGILCCCIGSLSVVVFCNYDNFTTVTLMMFSIFLLLRIISLLGLISPFSFFFICQFQFLPLLMFYDATYVDAFPVVNVF